MTKKTTVGTVAGGNCVDASLPKTETVRASDQPPIEIPDASVWQRHWKKELRRLRGLPLLAVGAGKDRKAPANLRNGELLSSWPTTTHTPGQIEGAHKRICGAGTRTGKSAGGLLVLDVDGATALSWLLERGCDPLTAHTWQIRRNTDHERLKVAWRLSEDQQALLGQLKAKVETRPAIKDVNGNVLEKGQAVELFHGSGQVVVLGEHPTSKGFYWWPEGMGPDALALIPPAWWEAVLAITGNTPESQNKPKIPNRTNGEWRSLGRCPICGRNTTGYCSEHRDGGTIRCFHGNTFNPEQVHGVLKPGQQITDSQGTVWALAKTEPQSNGDVFSVFITPKQQWQPPHTSHPVAFEHPDKLTRSFQALIQQLPAGWSETDKPRKLSPGRLAELLLQHRFQFNELDLRAYVETSEGWQRLTDADMDDAYVLLTGMGWAIGKDPVRDAVLHVARQTSVHPVREYLKRVEADPSITPYNLDAVAQDFFRSGSKLHSAMVRKWLIGAVWRAFEPGCQMDYCLVLQSDKQGLHKSTSFKTLASPEWFCSSIPSSDKDLLLNVHSCWIYELAELESITSKKQAGQLKNLITTSIDNMRPPYGRTSERLPRQSVFCGTVNKQEFLCDETGNRRFWVVPIIGTGKLDREQLTAARDSIWKAAVIAYRDKELPMLPEALERLSERQNEQFNEQDAWVGMVQSWMDGDPLVRWNHEAGDPSTSIYSATQAFTSAEIIYSAGLRPPNGITKADEMRVAEVLRCLGFKRTKQSRVAGVAARRWRMSQPSQPSQPASPKVVTPQTPTDATDQGMASQPSQPQKKKGETRRQGGGTAPTAVCEPSFGKGGCYTPPQPPKPAAGQLISASQPAFFEVVTPSEVVTPARGLQLTPGSQVEHQTPEGWCNGWTVADVVEISSGVTRYRIQRGGESLNVPANQIRLCGEVA